MINIAIEYPVLFFKRTAKGQAPSSWGELTPAAVHRHFANRQWRRTRFPVPVTTHRNQQKTNEKTLI